MKTATKKTVKPHAAILLSDELEGIISRRPKLRALVGLAKITANDDQVWAYWLDRIGCAQMRGILDLLKKQAPVPFATALPLFQKLVGAKAA